MIAIINWTPLEFIFAVPIACLLTVLLIGVAATVSEYLERRLIEWWTGEPVGSCYRRKNEETK